MIAKEHTQNWHRPDTQESYREIFVNGKDFIIANYKYPNIRIEEFCKNYGCKKRTAQRAFSFHGTSWQKYLVTIRMQQACRMLKNSSFSVDAIAKAVGYRQVSQFRRTFREHCNVSPSEYREQQR